MRTFKLIFALLILTAIVISQAPTRAQAPAAKAAPKTATATKPAPLGQVMRGILFPNANLLFDVQQNDPGTPKKAGSGAVAGSTTETFANVYNGWQMVQAAAASLDEVADVILKPRPCFNGKPAPVANADFKKFAAYLKTVARQARAAADKKDRDKLMDIDNDLSDACANCHEVYRDAGDEMSPARCVAKAAKK
jgi:hypothetical protein